MNYHDTDEYRNVIEKAEALAMLEECPLDTRHLMQAMVYSHSFGGWVLRTNGINQMTLKDLHDAYVSKRFNTKEVSISDIEPFVVKMPRESISLADFNALLESTVQELTINVKEWQSLSFSEQREHLFNRLDEATNVLLDAGAKGYAWIAVSPAVADMVKQWPDFAYLAHSQFDFSEKLSHSELHRIGILRRKWSVYEDSTSAIYANTIVIGVGDDDPKCSTMLIRNFFER